MPARSLRETIGAPETSGEAVPNLGHSDDARRKLRVIVTFQIVGT
jgi:hypothetical protein